MYINLLWQIAVRHEVYIWWINAKYMKFMVGLTRIKPEVWLSKPLKLLILFFVQDITTESYVYFYCQHYNLGLQDRSNHFKRHVRPVKY